MKKKSPWFPPLLTYYGERYKNVDDILLAGILWFLMKGVFDVIVNSHMRFLGNSYDYHPFQLVFFYSAMTVAAYLPRALRWPGQFRPRRPGLYVVRGVLEVGGFSLLFSAVALLPFATFTALTFVGPVIASIVAVKLLGEDMTRRKWVGLALGFLGVLVVARPDALFASFNWGVLMVLGAVLCFSFCGVTIRLLVRTEPPARIAFGTLTLVALFTAPLAAYHWRTPEWSHLPYLLLMGIGAAGAQYSVGHALKRVDITTVQPLTFTTLIWSALVGYLWFGEMIEWSTILGSLLILAGIVYSIRRRRPAYDATTGSVETVA